MTNYWKAIITLSILCLGLTAYIIWKIGPEPGTVESVTPLRDSIAQLKKQRLELESALISKNQAYDSLKNVKQTLKIKYHEEIKFVYTADPDELDSIIRSAIK